ncbi:hypothetical protein F7888_02255 [Bacillus sp. PS06]|nr:hypothetical protein [Bacillus sp. PS06]
MNKFESEVEVSVSYEDKYLRIKLKDTEGNIPLLEETHEKMMHLIVVSNDLKEFYHLHPTQEGNEFHTDISLSYSSYTAFVDINPKGKNYVIKPIRLEINKNSSPFMGLAKPLEKDQNLIKEIGGKTVELITDPLKVDEEVTLEFTISNGTPEPYLGALGHVVIIDQAVEQFIHVHPVSVHDTIFNTQFEKSGLYKLWAEFRFGIHVHAYPFVFEVK